MKKLLLGMAVGLVSLGSQAQSNSLGINGGYGKSAIKNYESHAGFGNANTRVALTNTEFMPHGDIGISYIHSTQTNFGFGADVKYSWEGARGENKALGLERSLSIQYLRVPVKVMYFFGKYGQRVRPKVYVGPSVGFMLGAEEKTTVNNQKTEVDVKNDFNGVDVGVIGGAGINYRIVRNTWFTADVNYYDSFRDIREQNSGGTPRLSNNTLALNVGINWGIGK